MGFSPKRNKTNSGGKNRKVCIPKNYKMELLSKKGYCNTRWRPHGHDLSHSPAAPPPPGPLVQEPLP